MKARKNKYQHQSESASHKNPIKPYTDKPPPVAILKPEPIFYNGKEIPNRISLIYGNTMKSKEELANKYSAQNLPTYEELKAMTQEERFLLPGEVKNIVGGMFERKMKQEQTPKERKEYLDEIARVREKMNRETMKRVEHENNMARSQNEVLIKDSTEQARKDIRDSLSEPSSGIYFKALIAGVTLASYHIEAGGRKFSDYAKRMIKDMGDAIIPYLKMFYNGIRDYPGFDSTGMDSYDDIAKFNFDDLTRNEQPMNKPMQVVEEAAKKKHRELDLDSPEPPKSYLADLLMAIYGCEIEDHLNLPMADKQDIEDQILNMTWLYPEGIVDRFLDEEVLDLGEAMRVKENLKTAHTIEELQEVLIEDFLYPAMQLTLDFFPNRGPTVCKYE